MQWYYAKGQEQHGPMEEQVLRQMVHDGQIGPNDLVWNASMGDQWAAVRTVPGLLNWTPGAGAQSGPARPAGTGGIMANGELTARAREALSGRWGTAIGLALSFFLINLVGNMVASIIPGGQLVFQLLVAGPFMLGFSLFFLSMSRGGEVRVGQLFDGFQRFGTAIWAYVLVGMYVFLWTCIVWGPGLILAAALFSSSMAKLMNASSNTAAAMPPEMIPLFLLMGIVALGTMVIAVIVRLRYALAFFLLADHPEMKAAESIRESIALMKGHKGKLFLLYLRFIGWSILCLLTCGIGYLWLWPYIHTSVAGFYDDVRGGE